MCDCQLYIFISTVDLHASNPEECHYSAVKGNRTKIEIERHAMLMLMKCAARGRTPRASGI